jgi:hypothetical protein
LSYQAILRSDLSNLWFEVQRREWTKFVHHNPLASGKTGCESWVEVVSELKGGDNPAGKLSLLGSLL